ncbi:Protein scribble-like protein [Armadillidium nasatum]|uniref:Protein scribble-like protein n=1 Tax=Armadillidium nasatum TaxID=96803 RepID=A0A5N5SR84_9CRUS|nr:Protein scribble-like protein [Armadillidium nasatum]
MLFYLGITRLPILEGEISHIELPRDQKTLGLTIVGGSDTPLRCVVVQEIFSDGLVAQDGRLQPGDQIIEVDGVDMTTASHQQPCTTTWVSSEKGLKRYKSSPASVASSSSSSSEVPYFGYQQHYDPQVPRGIDQVKEIITIPLETPYNLPLGVKIKTTNSSPGIFVAEIVPHSLAEKDGRLAIHDRILFINDEDVRYARVEHASRLIHNSQEVIRFVVSRDTTMPRERVSSLSQESIFGCEENDNSLTLGSNSSGSEFSVQEEDAITLASSQASPVQTMVSDIPMIERRIEYDPVSNYYESASIHQELCQRQYIAGWWHPQFQSDFSMIQPKSKSSFSQVFGLKKEGTNVLQRKQVRLTKKGDVVLSVNNNSLLGLTHSQAVALLKSTSEMVAVTLTLLEGPETCRGPSNFVPSWLYWQKLPRSLHISKSVVLRRPPGSSLGFSIVGGNDPRRGPEPIHVLFVVSTSPAAIDGRLRCGDRLLAVDGHCLESVTHTTAVSLLKQAGERVILEVVSWMGTEL